jgi:GAF domain-containing protein
MDLMFDTMLEAMRRSIASSAPRESKAREAAGLIRQAGGYRWVGLHDVGPDEVGVIAWDGPGAPSRLRFPVTQGLNGAAVVARAPVIVQDVSQDPRYLTTLGSTRAEMIVPILGASGEVVGTIDVESDEVNAFGERDRALLDACGLALRPLWGT